MRLKNAIEFFIRRVTAQKASLALLNPDLGLRSLAADDFGHQDPPETRRIVERRSEANGSLSVHDVPVAAVDLRCAARSVGDNHIGDRAQIFHSADSEADGYFFSASRAGRGLKTDPGDPPFEQREKP